jgi:hypothetical protein
LDFRQRNVGLTEWAILGKWSSAKLSIGNPGAGRRKMQSGRMFHEMRCCFGVEIRLIWAIG